MRATNKIESMADKKTVDTVELQTMLSSGRKTAVEIGTACAGQSAGRTQGIVICSSSAGYYLPANKDEIREFCNFMEKRAKHSFIAIQSARRALGEIEGQQTFMP